MTDRDRLLLGLKIVHGILLLERAKPYPERSGRLVRAAQATAEVLLWARENRR
jgi:hypothetical protein